MARKAPLAERLKRLTRAVESLEEYAGDEDAWLSLEQFPFLLREPLGARSLYETIRERTGTYGVRAESVIEVIRCDRDQAALLGVRRGAPALEVAGITYDEQDEPFEVSRVIYREDRFRFVIRKIAFAQTGADQIQRGARPVGMPRHYPEGGAAQFRVTVVQRGGQLPALER